MFFTHNLFTALKSLSILHIAICRNYVPVPNFSKYKNKQCHYTVLHTYGIFGIQMTRHDYGIAVRIEIFTFVGRDKPGQIIPCIQSETKGKIGSG